MYIKTNKETYNILQKEISNRANKDNNFSVGFLDDSLIGQLLRNQDNKTLEIKIDDTIGKCKILFMNKDEEIFTAYLYDFLSCLVIK